ncbi:MAG: DUF6249 domain-containing protein [Myxococcaceae bacterium]
MHTLALTLVLLAQTPAVTEPVAPPAEKPVVEKPVAEKPVVMEDDEVPASSFDTRLAGLTPEQRADVLVAHERAKNGGMVAILVPLGSFLFLLGGVALVLAAWVRIARERQLTLRHAIDKGVSPKELMQPPDPLSDRRRGILLVAIGVGLGIVVGATSEWIYASVGVLPLAVGAGYLINFRLAPKSKALPESAA